MKDNAFINQRIPSSMLTVFFEKALQLIHLETHLSDVSAPITHVSQNGEEVSCQSPFTLLRPHNCDITVTSKERTRNEIENVLAKEGDVMQLGKAAHRLEDDNQSFKPNSGNFPPFRTGSILDEYTEGQRAKAAL